MDWLDVQKLAQLALVAIAAGGGVVGIVGLIKRWFSIEDKHAQIASWVVSVIMALLAAVVSGEINPELFVNPVDAIVAIAMIILSVAKVSAGFYTFQKRVK
jgi:cytochrome b